MPIGFDPNDTTEIMLECLDGGKPPEQRARFTSHFLTARQTKEVEKLRNQASKASSDTETDELLNKAIKIGIVGWSNLKDAAGNVVEFNDEALDEFTVQAKFNIVKEYPLRLMLTVPERKKSGSPSNDAGE